MRFVLRLVGVLFMALGALWTLQGVGLVGGSFMTGQTRWIYVGLLTLAVGAVILALGMRFPPRR